MPASERASVLRRPQPPSMRDLLASCAAAAVVSTPPSAREDAAEAAAPAGTEPDSERSDERGSGYATRPPTRLRRDAA
ncbi:MULTISPECIES: hypothetical protein [Streptomyces]|uniref:Uncharacterized protein n=1 Tax=Streptomyces tsukubensis (strain DSM 42081 / NBRC 108919 / NRRL 18488 / 9993) TaxID=1114943 RepID=A0A7G3UCB0_STRT9|nr:MULTISPECIES: hypothetical protein [Streptomyces]AZK96004.1 hypothetical protein B7R87_20625 [Streptomyces tsukubensis]MYS65037.1 hypothetical protein [Streptomyces sp. SID5473]QKM67976.1 hypothetical protein STSU_013150 [Streptomyces tsukubensis NRRL18488]TAI44375.1 hypothetical protein EWI31_12950 [Streptomyces tsukubensis]